MVQEMVLEMVQEMEPVLELEMVPETVQEMEPVLELEMVPEMVQEMEPVLEPEMVPELALEMVPEMVQEMMLLLLEANKALLLALLSLFLSALRLDSVFGRISKAQVPVMEMKVDVLMMPIKSSSIKSFHPEIKKVSKCQLTTTHFENLMHKFKSFDI